ncbi:MAG: ADP-ribosylglycohydrolase family protein, partial [Ruminococcus sp.]|nr:ADP-ribosylglycohydrolase family protein [Ruminococcus sp.]
MRNTDKFRGCLIGGAAGDALGYAVEFLIEEQIFQKYGSEGIAEYRLKNGVAEISDDTQMTLFTANGLLAASAQNMGYTDAIREMYKCWFITQKGTFSNEVELMDSWLLDIPELFSCRAPGMTCLSAISQGAVGSVEHPINNSKGCGGVMRVAPVGLYFCDSSTPYEQSDMIAAEAAALTHGHELGYIPAAALAHIVRTVTERDITLKEAVIETISATKKQFPKAEHIGYFTALMEKAVTLAETDTDDLSAIHQLGGGWVAEETLAIAVYCALTFENNFDTA